MSQTTYSKSPVWNNDGTKAHNIGAAGTNYFAAPQGWVAQAAGVFRGVITAISGSGTVVTVTCAAGHGYPVGTYGPVVIQGSNIAAFNGYVPSITVTSSTAFTFASTATGVYTSGATVALHEVVVPVGGLDTVYADLIVIPTFTATVLPASGTTLGAGTLIKVQLTASEAVFLNTLNGVPYVNITIGGVTKRAVLDPAETTATVLDFDYTTVAGDAGAIVVTNAIQLNGGQILDVAGNHSQGFTPGTFTAPTTTATI